jgi:hypothetical protein
VFSPRNVENRRQSEKSYDKSQEIRKDITEQKHRNERYGWEEKECPIIIIPKSRLRGAGG